MLMASNIVLCLLYLAVGFMLRPLVSDSFEVAAGIIGITVGPFLLGLLFEGLASTLPRLGQAARLDDGP